MNGDDQPTMLADQPALDTEQQAPKPPPPSWKQVSSDPQFAAKSPDEKLVVFSRWHDDAYNHASAQPNWSQMADQFNQKAADIQTELGASARSVAPGGHFLAPPVTPEEAKYRVAKARQDQDATAPLPPDLQDAITKGPPEVMTRNDIESGAHYGLNLLHVINDEAGKMAGNTISGALRTMQENFRTGQTPLPDWLGGKAVAGIVNAIHHSVGLDSPTIVDSLGAAADFIQKRTKETTESEDPGLAKSAGAQTAKFVSNVAEPLLIAALFHSPAAALETTAGRAAAGALAKVGIGTFVMQHRLQTYGEVYNETNDPAQAMSAANRDTAANVLFLGQAHAISEGLGKVLARDGIAGIRGWVTKAVGATAGNVTTSQLTQAAEAAANAPEGERLQAFKNAFNTANIPDVALQAAFGVMAANGHTATAKAVADDVGPAVARMRSAAERLRKVSPQAAGAIDEVADHTVNEAIKERAGQAAPASPLQALKPEELDSHLQEIEAAVKAAPDDVGLQQVAERFRAERDRRTQAESYAEQNKTSTVAERTGAALDAAAPATPEADAAAKIENDRVDQNVRTRAEQIYNETVNAQPDARPEVIEETISKLRQRAQLETDPVERQAMAEAHRVASEQVDAAYGELQNQDRPNQFVDQGEAPGLRERTPPGGRQVEPAAPAAPEPPQPRPIEPGAAAAGQRALDLDVANKAIQARTDIAPERKAEFDQWAKARAAQERGEAPVVTGAEPTEIKKPDDEFPAGSKITAAVLTDPEGNVIGRGKSHAEALQDAFANGVDPEVALEAMMRDNPADYANSGHQFEIVKPDGTTETIDRNRAQSLTGAVSGQSHDIVAAADARVTKAKAGFEKVDKDIRAEVEDKFFGPKGIFYKIQNTHFDPENPKEFQKAIKRAVRDIEKYVKENPHLQEYYSQDMQTLRAVMDKNLKAPLTDDQFKVVQFALGATSPNTMLSTNVLYVLRIGENLQRDGDLSSVVEGAKGVTQPEGKLGLLPTHARMMQLLDKKIKELGSVDKAIDWFKEPVSREELDAAHQEAGYGKVSSKTWSAVQGTTEAATGQKDLVPRVFAFGNKAGAYTLNHLGDYRFNTTDKWESRFIRSYFPTMFEKATGIPLASEHEVFTRFAKDFKTAWEDKYGPTDNAGLQALRWYFVLSKARDLGYPYARTSETISAYAEKHYATRRGDVGGQLGLGLPEASGAGVSQESVAGAEAGQVNLPQGWSPVPDKSDPDKIGRNLKHVANRYPALFEGSDPLFTLEQGISPKGGAAWVYTNRDELTVHIDPFKLEAELNRQAEKGNNPDVYLHKTITEEVVHKLTQVSKEQAATLGSELIKSNPKLAREIAERYYHTGDPATRAKAADEMMKDPGSLYYEGVFDHALAIVKGQRRVDFYNNAPKGMIEHIVQMVKQIITRIQSRIELGKTPKAWQDTVQQASQIVRDMDTIYKSRFGVPLSDIRSLPSALNAMLKKGEAAGADYASTGRVIPHDELVAMRDRGAEQLKQYSAEGQSNDGIKGENWQKVKDNAYAEAQKSWGGVTIDPATGEPFSPPKQDSGPWATTVRQEGQMSVRLPEKATKADFDAAMEEAKTRFAKQLKSANHYLGVFHDDKLGTIDIDPVLITKTAAQTEEVGAHTKAVGGAYDFATGNGLFPPTSEGPKVVARDLGPNDQNAHVPTDERLREILTGKDVSENVKSQMVGAARDLPEGTHIGVRIDIPAFNRSGEYAQTIHDVNRSGGISHVLGYDSIVTVDDPKFYVSSEKGAQKIATGESNKFPLATVDGKYNKSREVPADINDWTPVGFDPKEHSFFYDKRTDQMVTGGDQAVSVGNTVFVKNPVYGDRNEARFADPNEVQSKKNEWRKLAGLAPLDESGGGIANRIAKARGVELEQTEGGLPEDVIQSGRDRLARGEKAEDRIQQLWQQGTKGKPAPASPEDFSLFRARAEQLQKVSDQAGVITPQETAFWNSVQPFRRQWAEMGWSMQGTTNLDTGKVSFVNYEREFVRTTGRAMQPEERAAGQKIVADIQSAQDKQTAAEEAIKNIVSKVVAGEKVVIPTSKEDLAKLIAEFYPKGEEGVQSAPPTVSNFPQPIVRGIWKYVADTYLTGDPSKQGLTLEDIERQVAVDLGMRPRDVRDVIGANKTLRKLSDDAYAAQLQRRQMVLAARMEMEGADLSKTQRIIGNVWNSIRSFVVLGHANAPLTHAGFHIFWPEYWNVEYPAIKKSFQIMFGSYNGVPRATNYETMRREVVEDPNYSKMVRLGLRAKWGAQDELAKYMLQGPFKGWGQRGNMAMDTLKWMRMEMAKRDLARHGIDLSKGDYDVESAKVIMDLVNNQTGILTAGTKGAQIAGALSNVAFAPQLEGARWKNIIMNPVKAVQIWTKGSNITQAERIFRNQVTQKTAKIAAGFVTALGVNQAALKAAGSKDDINFLDPTSSDWLAFKADGHVLTAPSNAIAPLRLMVAGILAPFVKNANSDFGDRLKNYAFGKAHPAITDIKELLEGKEAFTGKPLPWAPSKPQQWGKPPTKKEGIRWYEYAATKMPIIASQPLMEIRTALEGQGMESDQAKAIVGGLVGLSGALFAVHSHEYQPPKKAHEVPWADIFETR